MDRLDRIAEKFRGRTGKSGSPSRRSKTGRRSPPSSRDFTAAGELKQELLREYRNTDLLNETDFRVVTTEYGETFHSQKMVDKSFSTPETTPEDVLSDLKLIYGIGEVREKELKEEGYETVEDLVDHHRWGEKAESLRQVFREGNLSRAYDVMSRWKALSHPSFLSLSGLFERDQFAIVDIETLGLSNQPAFLLGLARPKRSGLAVHQFLAADLGQELATLTHFAQHLDELGAILTYNGKNFDLPYIERRLAYYGHRKKFSHPHFDLFLFTRRALSDRTRNCKLETIERSVLGIRRDLDIPSALVPEFYSTYLETDNPGPLLPILAHNRQDLLSLADLFEKLTEETLNGNP